MSVSLQTVKRWLRVIGTADDILLDDLILQAEDEALRYLNRSQPPTLPADYPGSVSSEDVPSSDDPIARSYEKAVCILVQAAYDEQDPDKQAKLRKNAETVLAPYRTQIGV